MLVKTELVAFGGGEIRMVDCPNDNPSLDEVYYWGQNDFQPQPRCSLSAGDLIHLNNKIYLIAALGFKEITLDAAEAYL